MMMMDEVKANNRSSRMFSLFLKEEFVGGGAVVGFLHDEVHRSEFPATLKHREKCIGVGDVKIFLASANRNTCMFCNDMKQEI